MQMFNPFLFSFPLWGTFYTTVVLQVRNVATLLLLLFMLPWKHSCVIISLILCCQTDVTQVVVAACDLLVVERDAQSHD